jgi:hypothetical protein
VQRGQEHQADPDLPRDERERQQRREDEEADSLASIDGILAAPVFRDCEEDRPLRAVIIRMRRQKEGLRRKATRILASRD